jgi:archaeosine synthase beta-subunit
MNATAAYPTTHAARDRFVLDRRGPRVASDPWRHQGVLLEEERAADGRIVQAATVFLTGRECPWRCVMCDLWTYTTMQDTPAGALVVQVQEALATLDGRRRPEQVKLYNAGSFFDPRAVPEEDYGPMAAALRGVPHVVVESHPLLVGSRLVRFRDARAQAAASGEASSIEVAMGLETAHPDALQQLHKRFTLDQFAAAAERLRREQVDLRVFVLVGVPFVPRAEQQAWVARSVQMAFACGATVVSLIPTRPGNGALEALAAAGCFTPPTIHDLEAALDEAIAGGRGRVFADLWNLDRLAGCHVCVAARRARLHAMNLTQRVLPPVRCGECAHGGASA